MIAAARDGLFPSASAADVSEERLRRFFTKEHRGYRARRELRESVLFAVHDLLKDSPFSRLDLISCRNLLIYLNREAQARAFDIFHFALRPEAKLFLGSSESMDDENVLFTELDKKHRLYQQRPSPRQGVPVPLGPGTLARALEAQQRGKGGPYVHGPAFTKGAAAALQRETLELQGRRVSWEELHFKLIERFAPPSLIVTRDYDIVHVSENAGRFLHFSGGEPSVNLLKVVHPMLRIELRAALFRAAQTSTPVEVFRVPLEMDGKPMTVDLRVSPAQEIAPDYLLVVFSVRENGDYDAVRQRAEAEPAVRHLEREIEQMKSRLRDTVEQYEASGEELKASNEELQAMNEELRSSAEELETSREELQSINEELTTVNQELKSKVDELGRANSDLANLMAATAIATIFLDRGLLITRYTPTAVALFRLIASDLGRPLTDLTHGLSYPELKADAESVLQTLIPVKREVSDGEGRWFLAQLQPYRTADDHIAGVVLSFVEITESRNAREALLASESRLQRALEIETVGIIFFKVDGSITGANDAFLRMSGYTRADLAAGLVRWDVMTPPEFLEQSRRAVEEYVRDGRTTPYEKQYLRKDGTRWWGVFAATRINDEEGVEFIVDVTERNEMEQALRESQERLRLIVENARDYAILSMDLDRRVTSWNSGAEQLIGYAAAEVIGQSGDLIFTPEDREAEAPEIEAAQARREGRATDERWHLRKDGSRFWGSGVMMAMHDAAGEAIGLVKIFRDQTAARQAQESLEQSRLELWHALQETEQARAEAEAAGRAKDHFLAVLSHELRTPLTPVLMAVGTLTRNKNLPPAAQEALQMIQRNVQLEAHFIDDLLDLTRISRGKLELLREPMDLHAAIHAAAEICQPDREAKTQRLELQLAAREFQLPGDFNRLQQVVWNLLKNASKFTPEGGEIRLRTRNEPGRVIIEITDSGIGFDPEDATRIFDAFAQASPEITREFGGLGLGLAISKATVEAHGGRIHAASPGAGQGATFTVELPVE